MSIFFIDYEITGYRGEIWFNGAPIVACPNKFNKNSLQVNEWIIDGENRVVLALESLASGEIPRNHLPADDDKSVMVELCEGPDNVPPGDGEYFVGASMSWPPGQPLSFPFRIAATCGIKSPFPAWRWLNAEQLPRNAETMRQAEQFVGEIHRILVHRALPDLETLMDTTFAEVAPAYGYEPEYARQRFRENYARIFADSNYAPAALEPEQFDFRYCCDNRLLEVRNKGGVPTIRHYAFEEGGWFLPLFIGREKGQWAVLR